MSNRSSLPYPEENEEKINTRKNWIKFGITAAAVAVGSYYGVGRYVKASNKDNQVLIDNVAAIGQFLAADSKFRDAFRKSQRDAIVAARNAGAGFTYYPGLGVLHHPKEIG